jgi:F420H(2)-dependent quinone reductase
MFKKMLLALAGLGAAGVLTVYLLTIPLLRRLPKQSRVSMDGITTIDDAVEACRQTHLQRWELVAYAQNLAAKKFTYSRLNTWDTPSRAFERGMGYCEQQALALKKIYDKLGIETRPVFCMRCKFPAKVVDGVDWPGGISGHAWLRVRIGDEERDVCPGSVNNRPGVTQFEVHSRVLTWYPWLRPFTHVGSSIENIRRDMMAQRTSRLDKEAGNECRNTLTPVLRRFGATRIGVWVIKHVVSPLDRWLYQLTGGQRVALGRPLGPLLLLTTTGRRSGKEYTTPVYYLQDGNRLVVCNVNPGFEHPNPWTLNLHANPLARVQIGAERSIYQAREANQTEIDRYWPRLVAVWPAYQTFYDRSGQRLVFVLEPIESSRSATSG